MKNYDHKKIEEKWREVWEKTGIYKIDEVSKKKKFYALDMFPYPSGDGLHVGHPKGYIATDVFSRMRTLQGFEVLHPMGWDAFGLPAENYAIKNKVHPRKAVEENIKRFKEQLSVLGFNYDWSREINTTDPEYYKWTQWIFLKLFEKGLAYESFAPIIWCPSCKTGLAHEDLEGSKCERCDTEVEKKPMKQWVLKITEYADRLLYDLDDKDLDWEELIKEQQRNWIGRSEGAEIRFKGVKEELSDGNIREKDFEISVFTTRPDTLFGATYLVLAPEHPLVESLTASEQKEKVEEYVKNTNKKTDLERISSEKDKTGVFIGATAINPVNGEKLPIWISDYVLTNYGTGAIMAVPAHDQRDFEFAKKFGLEIREVIAPTTQEEAIDSETKAYEGPGKLVNSGEYDGLTSNDAKVKVIDLLESRGEGQRTVNYKINDWVFARQRYWGEPIPLIHCEKCGVVTVPEKDLPVILPEVEKYEPTGTGESPLAAISDWVNVDCPKCGGKGKRETNTMPQWAGSCWYYLRYIDPKNSDALVDKDREKEWMPVDLYVGGAEHATRHLLYARFWHKFLYDIGVASTSEPFKRLVHVGLILAEDGRKMSKRWGNVINPDDIVNKFGADSLRIYEMFMGPFTKEIAWSTDGVKGVKRFLDKVWDIAQEIIENIKTENTEDLLNSEITIEETALARITHKTIKKVTEDIEEFKFNTAISAMMECVNEFIRIKGKLPVEKSSEAWRVAIENLIILLAPFAPHLSEEIWEQFGYRESTFNSAWPAYNKDLIKEETALIPIQVDGKIRDEILIDLGSSEETVKKLAFESEKAKNYTEGKEIVKTIYIPGKLLSIVTR